MAVTVKFFITASKATKKKADEVNILIRFRNGREFDFIAQSQKQINPEYWNNETGTIRQSLFRYWLVNFTGFCNHQLDTKRWESQNRAFCSIFALQKGTPVNLFSVVDLRA